MSSLMDDPFCGSIHSPYWAYNQPDWKPSCDRCGHRKNDCKKYNGTDPMQGRFDGRWICTDCVQPTDVKTEYQAHIDERCSR